MEFKVFFANLRRYNNNVLEGEWFLYPFDEDEIYAELKINGDEDYEIYGEEYIVLDDELPFKISEFETIDSLNDKCERVEHFLRGYEQYAYDILKHIDVEYIEDGMSVEIIEGTGYEKLGYFLIHEWDYLTLSPEVEMYFDYEAFGWDMERFSDQFYPISAGWAIIHY